MLSPSPFDPTLCGEIPSAQNTILTGILCVGTFLSYLPQHIKIIKHRTSEGISPYFILLGTTGAGSNITNMLLLQFLVMQCCTVQTWGAVPAGDETAETSEASPLLPAAEGAPKRLAMEWKVALWVATAVAVHGTMCILMSTLLVAFMGPYSAPTRTWASLLGLFSLCTTCMQFIPQIIKTWRSGQVGALSIPMMLMQTPGGFVFAYSIAIRPGVNWSSWISTFVAATLQGVLLTICLVFERAKGARRAQDSSAAAAGAVVENEESASGSAAGVENATGTQ
ncbi:hypothetical protein FBU59_001098 [Linderina macrospora]|uniref:Uncharacterized protein n=1 Tax=Linderina macrospora TaxID=4868 RepID=A0ACC1JEZ9_9FUNG|nr:hypothetical protein FBU59_001098 [Linderina macrospora]